jgi:E3 ubiquitin-protein ligase RNF216
MEEAMRLSCIDAVLGVFPDICPDHLERLAAEKGNDPEQVISHVVDEIEQRRPYPKRPKPTAKRKREDSEEPLPDLASKYENPERGEMFDSTAYSKLW